MNGLLTDLYELTMAAGYFAAGKHLETATFELTIRRLPRNRDFVVAAGLHHAADYLLNLSFTANEIAYLRGLPSLRNADPAFWDYLAEFRFTGDVFAVPEGAILYEGQPVMNVRAPLIEGQIPETYLLAAIGYETLVATKAARIVHAAAGREIIEFGTRRAHTPEAGVLGARAAYIGGCAGTSNALAGYRYGIPVMGTAAHSWVMSFASESEAFERLQRLLGERTVQLIDTYDTLEGARTAARVGRPLWGVRIDSGDLAQLAREVRAILDKAGLTDARIMASGDLDESKIELLRESRCSDRRLRSRHRTDHLSRRPSHRSRLQSGCNRKSGQRPLPGKIQSGKTHHPGCQATLPLARSRRAGSCDRMYKRL